jgi:hypothetical protein
MTIGWRFTANQDILATQLGFWDSSPGTPLGQSHQVGLWNSTGSTLLGSTTVETTSPLTGAFRYEPITPVLLTAGNTYVLGAALTSPFLDVYAQFSSMVTTAPEITFISDTRNASAGGFSFPGILDGNLGRFGPNFQFQPAGAVPEPSSLLLLGLGAGCAVSYAWRRQKRKGIIGQEA